MQISCFDVIAKGYQKEKWRLILDFSYPNEGSVNDKIVFDICSLVYTSMGMAARHIQLLGKGTHWCTHQWIWQPSISYH